MTESTEFITIFRGYYGKNCGVHTYNITTVPHKKFVLFHSSKDFSLVEFYFFR